MNEFVLKHGLKNIFAAEIRTYNNEAGEGYTTGDTFHLIPAGEMSRTVNSEKTDIYYDDSVFATVGKEDATDVQITGAALRPDALARINNKEIDATTGAVVDSGEYTPKYFALGGEAENLDGTTELFWFAKGTFSIPDLNDKTKDDTTDTNGMQLTFSAIKTQHIFALKNKPCKRVVIDTSKTELKSGKSWTEQVVTPDNLSTICQLITASNSAANSND
jgi:phi13 family phage major tail protein